MIMVVFRCGPFLLAFLNINNTWKEGGEGSKPVSKFLVEVKYTVFIVYVEQVFVQREIYPKF